MKKLVTVGVLLAVALAMAAEANVPDVLTAIATRKSIRKFDPLRAVEDEKVEKVLKAAMCAPSAMDKRPWEFVVVKNKWTPAKIHADRW